MALKWCILVSLIVYISSASIKEDNYDLNIVHFNDFHARFEETSTFSGRCVPSNGKCIGGFPRLYKAIMDAKKMNPDSVVLNSGDSFQGTFWYNILRWNVTQYFMNMLPLDAHTLGNHEFDHGIKDLVDYLKTIKAPMVVANIDDSLEPTLQGLHNKSVIIERKGQKIGIIGAIIATTSYMSKTGKLIFNDEVQAIKDEADQLAAQGINKIIVLSHCGIDIDRKIAKEAGSNIDVIVGGHSHSLLYTGSVPSNEVPVDVYPIVVKQDSNTTVLIVQASAYAKYFGIINVSFDAAGKIQSWEGVPYYLDHNFEQDTEILKLMVPFREILDRQGKRIIGNNRIRLSKKECRAKECNIGDFICDAMVDHMTKMSTNDSWTYAAVSFINVGYIRADIDTGDITYEDLMNSVPFGNSIQTFDLKGKHILEALEYSINVTGNSPFYSYTFLQVSGLRLVYDMRNPPGHRVKEALIRCANCKKPKYYPLEKETFYKVVSHSYLADGKRFYMISNNKINVEVWNVDYAVLEEYIKKESPIVQGTDMRIVIIE